MFKKIMIITMILFCLPTFAIEAKEVAWESGQPDNPETLTYCVYRQDKNGITSHEIEPGELCYKFELTPVDGMVLVWVTARDAVGNESEGSNILSIKYIAPPKNLKLKRNKVEVGHF